MDDKVIQQLGKAANDMEKEILEYVKEHADAAASERILKDKLTLKGCVEYCFKQGHKYEVKSAKSGFARISPEQHWEWVRKYFGLKDGGSSKKAIRLPVPENDAVPSGGLELDLDDLFD